MRKTIEILDVHDYIYNRDQHCQYPGCYNADYMSLTKAHRIKQGRGSQNHIMKYLNSKYNVFLSRKQADLIIHNPLNMVLACPGSHNDYFNIFFNKIECNSLIDQIWSQVKNGIIKNEV